MTNLDYLPAECGTFEGFLEWLDEDENFVEFAAAAKQEIDSKETTNAGHEYIKSSIRYRLATKFKEVYMKLLDFKMASTQGGVWPSWLQGSSVT